MSRLTNREAIGLEEIEVHILATIVDTVILSGRQNFALRGHRDDSKDYSTNAWQHSSSFKLSNEWR